MKKVLIILVIVLIPAMAFADFQVGATALYDGDITQIGHGSSMSVSDFVFGLDVRAKLWIFQIGTTPLYIPGAGFYLMNDAGLSLDIWFLRIGLGLGPDIAFSQGDSGLVDWNLRATADIKFGDHFSIGAAAWYFMDSPSDLRDIGDIVRFQPPFVSINMLFKLF